VTSPSGSKDVARLLAYAGEADLFHTPDNRCYSTFPVEGHVETWYLGSGAFRAWLSRKFWQNHHKMPTEYAFGSALDLLEGKARFEGSTRQVLFRLAESDGVVWLDLMNEYWNVVRIDTDGWSVVSSKDLPDSFRFRRPKGALSLPVPDTEQADITPLRRLLNLPNDDDGDAMWSIVIGWLIGALRPHGPYPLLLIHGEQGSGKSTACRVIRSVIDPNASPLRSPPRNDHELMVSAMNSWIVALENLSHIKPVLSDALCRLATGGGFSARQLYTDAEEYILDASRPIMLNGIDDFVVRADLLDRSIWLSLPAITPDNRRTEEAILAELEDIRPVVLAGLLDGVAAAVANADMEIEGRLPRMADFATWVTRAEEGLGWPEGEFLAVYDTNREGSVDIALANEPVAGAIQRLVTRDIRWRGTPAELLDAVTQAATAIEKRAPNWPGTPLMLSNTIRRLAMPLRRVDVLIETGRTHGRSIITLTMKSSGKRSGAGGDAVKKRPFRIIPRVSELP
jgi:hypothetical protein